MARYTDKVVVITGGAGGIGIAAGQLFADGGAKVLLVDLNEDSLKSAAKQINSDNVSYCVADVTQPEQVEAYVDTAVTRYGGIDCFLNNAGVEGVVTPITDYPVEVFDKVIEVNVKGVWLGLKYVMPAMKKRGGGSIVITSSVAGVIGSPGLSAYVTSKHAVIGIMRTASLEGAADNIRVNTVNPSPVDTRMMRSLEEAVAPGAAEQAKQSFEAGIPLQRYGSPEDVANMMGYLCSDEASFCTGSVYMVDGGSTAT
ncbi:MAG: SDR family oxidoreductase [Pseudomonadales bacterium]|nr:SDR family oxidoreductase [Pseudomonadales bacterium]